MTSLIVYESRFGYTKSCAIILQKALSDAKIVKSTDDISLEEYDCVLIGTPIYKGELDKDIIHFITKNKWKLLDRKLAIFCSGMNTEEFNVAVQDSIPADIFIHAEIVHCGGEIKYHALSWKDKRMVKKRLGIKSDTSLDYKYKLNDLVKWVQE